MIWPLTEAAEYEAIAPEDKVFLCATCNGTVVRILFHRLRWRPWKVDMFATFPCQHVHDIDTFDDFLEQT